MQGGLRKGCQRSRRNKKGIGIDNGPFNHHNQLEVPKPEIKHGEPRFLNVLKPALSPTYLKKSAAIKISDILIPHSEIGACRIRARLIFEIHTATAAR
jgi:hypothetical protein